ncbi:MAG: sporulation protein YabP [Ruminococcus sp.]|nr:sporulation protein YabP [Ruminococcus sp.]MCD7800340.1 sporulation protein YabP [Ruminococcus sp.]
MNNNNNHHNVIMEGRSKVSISGVTDVDCFDENTILIYTIMGELTIKGKNLQVNDVSVETGDMSLQGDVWSIVYGDKDKRNPLSWFAKLFR